MNNNVNNKKEAFICDTLLPYCLQRIEEAENKMTADNLQKMIATMEIFPYKWEGQVMYGALKDPEIRWYFVSDKETQNVKSTDCYRLLDKSQMKPDLFKKFKQIFGVDGCSYICEFSDQVVIEDLVKKMSKERDYTEKWWKCAMDAFSLWNTKTNPGNAYEIASKEIRCSYMLFDDEYCEPQYQRLLERYRLIEDIRKTTGYIQFIGNISNDKRSDAIRFLKYLGVRSSFVNRNDWDEPTLCEELIQLFGRIGKASFPIATTNIKYYELCELSSYLFFNVLLKEDIRFAKKLLNDKKANIGIMVKNINDAYMPLGCDMFYLSEDFDMDFFVENRLNMFIVKNGIYTKEELGIVGTSIDNLSGISNYYFGNINVRPIAFYKWAWKFTQNNELVESILEYFNSLSNIEINLEDFALDVMEVTVQRDLDVSLQYKMNVSGVAALLYNSVLNKVYRKKKYNVLFFVQDNIFKEMPDVKYRILLAIEDQISSSMARTIETADFWNKIYLLHSSEEGGVLYGRYAIAQYNDAWQGYNGDIILLSHEEDMNSYIEALCEYISDTYDICLSGVTADWKSEYYALVHGVDGFICDHRKAILSSKDEIMFEVSNMADVVSLKDELSFWDGLRKEKAAIMRNRISDIDLKTWDSFLNNKYHGRCQLCHARTASGSQNAFYWTYRIKKKSENDLANMHSNIFCLCPSCHGELSHGYLGKDLTKIKERAFEYIEQLEDCLQEGLDDPDTIGSVVSSFAETKKELPGFLKPIICDVVVNGHKREMVFSWEHFMKIAFLLSGINDVVEEG